MQRLGWLVEEPLLQGHEVAILPYTISSAANLKQEFQRLFTLPQAQVASLVYFFATLEPLAYPSGETGIFYIGKTDTSIRKRYLNQAGHLARGGNKAKYTQLIESFGGVIMGYITTPTPRPVEKLLFRQFRHHYGRNPLKSRRG